MPKKKHKKVENKNQNKAPEKDSDAVYGIVTEALPNTMFKVMIEGKEDEPETLSYLAGKMRMYRIKVLVGDKVELVLDPYGGKARITKRL